MLKYIFFVTNVKNIIVFYMYNIIILLSRNYSFNISYKKVQYLRSGWFWRLRRGSGVIDIMKNSVIALILYKDIYSVVIYVRACIESPIHFEKRRKSKIDGKTRVFICARVCCTRVVGKVK